MQMAFNYEWQTSHVFKESSNQQYYTIDITNNGFAQCDKTACYGTAEFEQ